MKHKTWIFYPENQALISNLSAEAKVPEIVSRILINRGIEDPADALSFLKPKLDDMLDPCLMADMDKATERIKNALKKREKILIYGDFDTDGITSTALLVHLFKCLNKSVSHYIPNRISEGYSFTQQGLKTILEKKIDLVISVDSGISSFEEISFLRQNNVDVIITDHHEPPAKIPPANAIINPKCKRCEYPFKHLSGVGVAFKLAWGVAQHLSQSKKVSPEFRQFLLDALAWVAMGTVADLVPLTGENRIFARYGLPAIINSTNPGMRALCDMINEYLQPRNRGPGAAHSQRLTSEDISYRLAPRINAAGRMGLVEVALNLFLTSSYKEALGLASELDDLNKQRQVIERDIFTDVLTKIDACRDDIIITGSENWHPGVIGIAASRLVEEYGKPAILFSYSDDMGRGSGRSVPGFDIHKALTHCSDHLETFGGHSSAVGLSIKRELMDPFIERISLYLKKAMPEADFKASLNIDCEIQLSALSHNLLSQIDKLRPFGEHNPAPIFASSNVLLARPAQQVGRDSNHLSFFVKQGAGKLKAIAFGRGEDCDKMNSADSFSLAYTPKMNFFNGRSNIELHVKDILF